MTKDYAKKQAFKNSRAKRISRDKNTFALPSWAYMLFGLLLGGTISGFFFWKLVYSQAVDPLQPTINVTSSPNTNNDTEISSSQIATLKSLESLKEKSKPEVEVEIEEEPRFDFYTLLPNLTVEVPDVATPKQVEKTETIAPERLTPEAYILQIGSFRDEAQAEELKVRLILQGQEAKIQTVKINPTDIWYRVYIGPYALKADALEIQQKLHSLESADSLILKIRV